MAETIPPNLISQGTSGHPKTASGARDYPSGINQSFRDQRGFIFDRRQRQLSTACNSSPPKQRLVEYVHIKDLFPLHNEALH